MSHDSEKPKMTDSDAVRIALARASRTWGGYQAWRQLDPERRLQAVECALKAPANDCIDELPLAL